MCSEHKRVFKSSVPASLLMFYVPAPKWIFSTHIMALIKQHKTGP